MFWLLAEQLADRGNEIVVATSDALGPNERTPSLQESLGARIVVHRFRNRSTYLSTRLMPLFLRPVGMKAGLRELVKTVDVVHMGESRGIHNVWASQACARHGTPLVWSAYGGLATASGLRGTYRRLHDLAFTRSVVPRVSRFVAQTDHEVETYRQHGAAADRIRTIPLCVDWRTFEQLPERGGFRRRIEVPPDAPMIVCLARLSPVKGIDTLLHAFAGMPRREAFLAVVGWDHGALSSLTTLAGQLGVSPQVRFCGPLYGDDRLNAYVDADLFALTPRVYEETSLAALEAAACGAPTALTRRCEIPGLAQAGGGILMDNDVDRMSEALAGLLDDRARRQAMGTAARCHVREHFSAERVAAQHEQVFGELIG
jgi:glycosyltransferase involved in cell wall biosynthesis